MTSPTSIRKIRKRFEEAQGSSDENLFDIPELHSDEEPMVLKIGGIAKSPLHLLVMLDTPDCPLKRGDNLYVKVGSKNHESDRTPIVIEDWNKIHVHGKTVNSVNALMKEIGGNDGWANTFIANPVRPGKFLALATVFLESFSDFQYSFETLQDFDRLAKELLAQGKISETEIDSIQLPTRIKKNGTA